MDSVISALYFGGIVLLIGAYWQIYVKAGEPGWASLIPIYNAYVLLRIAGKPGWWLILLFIPVVNIVVAVMACLGLAQAFGKGTGFTIGLILLPFIFIPILGFSDAKYIYLNNEWRQGIISNADEVGATGSPLRIAR